MDLKTLQNYKRMMEEHRIGLRKLNKAKSSDKQVGHSSFEFYNSSERYQPMEGDADYDAYQISYSNSISIPESSICPVRDPEDSNFEDSTLLTNVKEDLHLFLKSWPDLLRNEIDFQIHLGSFLLTSPKNYERVFFEYRIPNSWVADDYVWDSNLRIDIVVYRDGEYLPIELKYPTAIVKRSVLCFDEDLNPNPGKFDPILKHQGATDLVCYNFWKDVRRLEVLKHKFKRVKRGLAVLPTNDRTYVEHKGKDTCCTEFRIAQGMPPKGPGMLAWRGDVSLVKSYPPFELSGQYPIDWQSTEIE
ncbi:MAG: hypothetical protein K2K97_09490, partial [Muribaculaceae bacterium]|nr:hypothetical protein [Muribaculaceae bacterium]